MMSNSLIADSLEERLKTKKACAKLLAKGLRPLADNQTDRFLGKVKEDTANCRGGQKALKFRDTVWVDWSNYWAAGDSSSKSKSREGITVVVKHLKPNGRGLDGTLLDLEYQRMELIRFNLYDNNTYEQYVKGIDTISGTILTTWDAMRLPKSHPDYTKVTSESGEQLCKGELIRYRNITGICNDIYNPAMGSVNQLFARNVSFESTYPDLGKTELIRNRHADRLGLLKPDPQVISRTLFTRAQSKPDACNQGLGLPNCSKDGQCDYKKAPFFNVLAAYWIQFMTHDWFNHLREGQNATKKISVGCKNMRVNNKEQSLTKEQIAKLGCRPEDEVDVALIAGDIPAPEFEHKGKKYMSRAHKTTQNTNTAWWDASQLYGYDENSQKRVKRDSNDSAKLQMIARGNHKGAGEKQGYLPVFESTDPINPVWEGQEATGFPGNWTIGLSFYHNLFVDTFRKQAIAKPLEDSGLRNPTQ